MNAITQLAGSLFSETHEIVQFPSMAGYLDNHHTCPDCERPEVWYYVSQTKQNPESNQGKIYLWVIQCFVNYFEVVKLANF